MTLEFRLLGPLEVRSNGRTVPMTSAKQRVLLATLLVHANRTVSTDELANRLWDNDSPSRNTLHTYVMRLRRTLGEGAPLITRPDGYLIEVAPDALDTSHFESLVRQANAAGDDPHRVADLLRAALDLWRGDPLADIPSDHLRREMAPLWRERRLATVESRVDADLRLGRHQDVATELADLTTRHPLRERFWAQRMLALYRSGRTAEALRCYTEIRALLADELGTDPSPDLRDLHRSILTDAPSLAIPVAPTRPRRNDLPGDIPDFIGRADEFDRLLAIMPTSTRAVVISAIDGMAGIGKTTLAVHAAHHLADHYPDGQLFIDLRGHTENAEPLDPAAALDTLLRALDVPSSRIPAGLDERAALWRAELASRKVLVLLDNASTASQVRPLLPGSPTCLALITSRRRLGDLDTTATLSLDVLPEADAVALFTSVVGAERVAADPESTSDVLRLCGYLPLAIRIAAARLRTRPTWPIRALADRLRDATTELTVGDRSVTAALALSHHRLTEPQQRMFALLARHPGTSFDGYQAAALAGIPHADAEHVVGELVDMHLVVETTPGRYRYHDLVRQYARTATTVAEPVRRDAVGRLLDHYRHVARTVDAHLNPINPPPLAALIAPGPAPAVTDTDTAVGWCETELANLTAAIDLAATDGWATHARQIAHSLHWFFKLRGHTTEWIGSRHVALAVTDDDNDRAKLLRQLGEAYFVIGDHSRSLDFLTQARSLFRRCGDHWGEGAALGNIGTIHFYAQRFPEAIDYYQQDIAAREKSGDLRGIGLTLSNLSYSHAKIGQFAESLRYGHRALEVFRGAGDRRGEGVVLGNIAWSYLCVAHDPKTALSHALQALAIDREVGDRRNEMCVLDTIGLIHRELGDHETALEHLHRALAMAMEIGSTMFEDEFRTNILDTYRLAAKVDR